MERQCGLLWRPPCRHRANSRDDIGGATGIIEDTLYQLARFRDVRLGSIEPPKPGFAVGHHGGERLIDLMRDRRSDLPEHRKPRRVREVRLRLLESLLGANPVGYVDSSANTDTTPFQPGSCKQDVDFAAVKRDKLYFFLKCCQSAEPGFHCASKRIGRSLPKPWSQQLIP